MVGVNNQCFFFRYWRHRCYGVGSLSNLYFRLITSLFRFIYLFFFFRVCFLFCLRRMESWSMIFRYKCRNIQELIQQIPFIVKMLLNQSIIQNKQQVLCVYQLNHFQWVLNVWWWINLLTKIQCGLDQSARPKSHQTNHLVHRSIK